MTRVVIFDCDGTLVDGQAAICDTMYEAFAAANFQRHAGQRAHGAETLFDAVQQDDRFHCGHRRGSGAGYIAPLMTPCASSSEYSTLATPPASVFSRFSSRLS